MMLPYRRRQRRCLEHVVDSMLWVVEAGTPRHHCHNLVLW
jgi:hypothetical protein